MANNRVQIRYKNDTTVEATNLGDALFHIAHTGSDDVVDVIEEPVRTYCEHCNGTGVAPDPDPVVILTSDQIEDKLASVDEHAPVGQSSVEDRVKAARRAAKG